MDGGVWQATVHGGRKELDTTEVTWHIYIYMCVCLCVYIYIYLKNHNCSKTVAILDFSGGPVVKNLSANVGDTGSIPGLGRSHMPRSN